MLHFVFLLYFSSFAQSCYSSCLFVVFVVHQIVPFFFVHQIVFQFVFFCCFSFTKSCGSACFVFAFFFVHLIRFVFLCFVVRQIVRQFVFCFQIVFVHQIMFQSVYFWYHSSFTKSCSKSHLFLSLYNSLNRVLVHFFVFFSCTKSYPTSCHCDNNWAKHK